MRTTKLVYKSAEYTVFYGVSKRSGAIDELDVADADGNRVNSDSICNAAHTAAEEHFREECEAMAEREQERQAESDREDLLDCYLNLK